MYCDVRCWDWGGATVHGNDAGEMAVRPILTIGDPSLRERSAEVSEDAFGSAALERLVANMIETMRANDGIGIAAPQIGELLRVAVVEIPEDAPRYPGAPSEPLMVFVNPVVTVVDGEEQEFWEGCLSVPDLRGLVRRPRAARVEYRDCEGGRHSLIAEDFFATVVQHEFDHLDGVLFIDRVRDTRELATVENYQRFIARGRG